MSLWLFYEELVRAPAGRLYRQGTLAAVKRARRKSPVVLQKRTWLPLKPHPFLTQRSLVARKTRSSTWLSRKLLLWNKRSVTKILFSTAVKMKWNLPVLKPGRFIVQRDEWKMFRRMAASKKILGIMKCSLDWKLFSRSGYKYTDYSLDYTDYTE